jgi:phosphoribosylaminoimidazolecarboxamide formyltransferase/IMP cyclohydrolase
MIENGMHHIEVFAGNLYPFDKAIQKEGITIQEAAHQIDIGGPAMVRAAAKASLLYDNTYVVVSPEDYKMVINVLETNGHMDTDTFTERDRKRFRQQLAKKAFAHTAQYEKRIDEFLSKEAKA